MCCTSLRCHLHSVLFRNQMQIVGRRHQSDHHYMTRASSQRKDRFQMAFATTLQHTLPHTWLIMMKSIDIQPPHTLIFLNTKS